MEKTLIDGFVDSMIANADLTVLNRFYNLSSGKLVLCGAGEKAIGVPQSEANEDRPTSIKLGGLVIVEVGSGGVTENDEVASDATGKAVAAASLAATATLANAVIPSGSTPVTSDGAQPTLTMTQPTITLAGGALPVKINGKALETVAEGGFARIWMN